LPLAQILGASQRPACAQPHLRSAAQHSPRRLVRRRFYINRRDHG
jgi:hypothetical protein